MFDISLDSASVAGGTVRACIQPQEYKPQFSFIKKPDVVALLKIVILACKLDPVSEIKRTDSSPELSAAPNLDVAPQRPSIVLLAKAAATEPRKRKHAF